MTDTPLTARSVQRLGQVLLDELKERLLDGRYAPVSRISIEDVRAEFGMSKQPVMDAMRRLEATGLVEIIPQSGCRVASYSLWEVRDFFILFGRFEGEIAAAAAERRSADQLAALDATWQRLEELQSRTDVAGRSRGYRQLNRELHLVIHQMAHSRVMGELSARMWDMSDFFISTLGGAGQLSQAVADCNHDVIRSAIRTRNVEVARVAMQSHITGTLSLFKTPLEETA